MVYGAGHCKQVGPILPSADVTGRYDVRSRLFRKLWLQQIYTERCTLAVAVAVDVEVEVDAAIFVAAPVANYFR